MPMAYTPHDFYLKGGGSVYGLFSCSRHLPKTSSRQVYILCLKITWRVELLLEIFRVEAVNMRQLGKNGSKIFIFQGGTKVSILNSENPEFSFFPLMFGSVHPEMLFCCSASSKKHFWMHKSEHEWEKWKFMIFGVRNGYLGPPLKNFKKQLDSPCDFES